MKFNLPIFLLALLCQLTTIHAQVGINADGTSPDSTAILDIASTSKGLLIPRMTTANRTTIQSPASGLLVYDIDSGSFWYYENSQWNEIGAAADAFLSSNGVTASTNNGDDFVFGADSLNFASGHESLLFFDKGLSAFRAGRITSKNWDTDSLGVFSVAGGDNTKASNVGTTAFGSNTMASGAYATALGNSTTASGRFSFASGNFNTASGDGAVVYGINNTVSGDFSIAVGGNLQLTKGYSANFGLGNNIFGNQSLAAGVGNVINGGSSFASGVYNTTNGEGANVLGIRSLANGDFSNAFGIYVSAPSFGETVIGYFNTPYVPNDTADIDLRDRLFVIGNGQNDTVRSDVLRVYKNGNVELNGALTIDSAYTLPIADGASGQILTTDGNGNTSWADEVGDDLGNHTATQNIRLENQWLSNDGGNEGLKVEDNGDVIMGGDLILGATNSINLRGNLKAISFFDYSANDFDIFLAAPVLFEGDLKLNGNWISNDGGNEGIQILNNGKVRLSSDLILPTGGINITDNTTGISFFNPGPNQYEIFMAQPVLLNSGMRLNGSWMSNDGGNEGISIDNNGVVTTSNLLQVGGYVAANNYLSISNNGQALTLAADEANNRIVLDVGGSGHSGDAIVLGEVGTGSKNPVLMQGNLVVGGLSSPSSNYKLTVNGEPAANGYRQFTNYSDRRLKHNIQNMGSALERIAQLRPVSFQYTAQTGYDSTALATTFRGFIAQELREVFPDMVGEIQLADNTYLDANLSALPIYLVKAMQEQQTLIDELREVNRAQKETLALQQSEMETLKAQVAKIDRLEAMLLQLKTEASANAAPSFSSHKK